MWIWMTCCKKLKNRVWSVMLLDFGRSTEIFKLEKQVVRMKEEDLKMPCWCQLTTGIGNILCAALADMSAMFVFLCLWPRIPLRILMRSSVFLNNIGESISLPKPRRSGPKAWLWKRFIYSVGVWWKSHAVYPNNRLSFWWRRHTDRTQQPEFIPLKYCLLPGRSQGHIRVRGHVHTYEDSHGKSLHFLYEYSSQRLSQMLIYLFK